MPKPLLKPSHFRDSDVSLGARGIEFEILVTNAERQAFIDESGADWAEHRVRELTSRGATRCVVNPESLPAPVLREQLRSLQGELKFELDWGMGEHYDPSWMASSDDEGTREGQTLVVVAFFEDVAVGFTTLGVSLDRHVETPDDLQVRVSGELTFVGAVNRGKGYGVDMAIACGEVLFAIVGAAYQACPSGMTLQAHLRADYDSEGGERFTRHLVDTLELQFDLLRESGKRSVQIGEVDLDAGY